MGWQKEDMFLYYDSELSDAVMAWVEQAYHQYSAEQKPLEYIL